MGPKEAANLGHLLDEHQVTFMSSVPALWKLALKLSKPPQRNALRQVNIGSAPLSVDLWQKIIGWTATDKVVNMYGITETANWLAGTSLNPHNPVDGLVGKMWGGVAAIRMEEGKIHPVGQGEICVQSPSLMSGYHKRPDLTDQVLKGGWFFTGDIGTVDAEGIIRITGRQKHEINRAGIKIHPEEIDLLLEQHPLVSEACCFGIPDDISGELVGVAVRLVNNEINDAALKVWCKERIKSECVPERWFFVSEIPKTDRGKINRETVMKACLNKLPT
ncbi:MAG: fatty acid--CoA ligase family protein [Alphaproteobacteria bacterium]